VTKVDPIMFDQLIHLAKRIWDPLAKAAHQLFRRVTQPALSNPLTGTLADLPRSRAQLLAENAFLRQQLAVLHRQTKTPRLAARDRPSLLLLAPWGPNWKSILQIVQPDTLLRWHRAGFRLFWRWQSRRRAPARRLEAQTLDLIQRLARENRLWGVERIRGELLKLGVHLAKRTIQKHMHLARSQSPAGQSWSTFLKNQGQDIWACDFVPEVTLFFQTVYAFVIIHLSSRRVIHVNATRHPTDAWVARQLREATPFGQTAKHLICDNDTKYGPLFDAAAQTCGLEVIHTPYEAPRAKSIRERFVGSLRRECLDHMLVLGDRQLVRVLKEYSGYFDQARPHQGLAQQPPETRWRGQANGTPRQPAAVPAALTRTRPARGASVAPGQSVGHRLTARPVLNGLHHAYAWAT
jgi:putative transposase